MPLKLSVGISRKLGLPNYSSIGASCHLEVELEGGLISQNPDDLQRHVRRAYVACRQAVLDELAQSQRSPDDNHAPEIRTDSRGRLPTNGANGHATSVDSARRSFASPRQLRYAEQLFAEVGGSESCPLAALTHRLYEKPLEGLTSVEASDLIDTLQGIRNGELNLDELLSTEAA